MEIHQNFRPSDVHQSSDKTPPFSARPAPLQQNPPSASPVLGCHTPRPASRGGSQPERPDVGRGLERTGTDWKVPLECSRNTCGDSVSSVGKLFRTCGESEMVNFVPDLKRSSELASSSVVTSSFCSSADLGGSSAAVRSSLVQTSVAHSADTSLTLAVRSSDIPGETRNKPILHREVNFDLCRGSEENERDLQSDCAPVFSEKSSRINGLHTFDDVTAAGDVTAASSAWNIRNATHVSADSGQCDSEPASAVNDLYRAYALYNSIDSDIVNRDATKDLDDHYSKDAGVYKTACADRATDRSTVTNIDSLHTSSAVSGSRGDVTRSAGQTGGASGEGGNRATYSYKKQLRQKFNLDTERSSGHPAVAADSAGNEYSAASSAADSAGCAVSSRPDDRWCIGSNDTPVHPVSNDTPVHPVNRKDEQSHPFDREGEDTHAHPVQRNNYYSSEHDSVASKRSTVQLSTDPSSDKSSNVFADKQISPRLSLTPNKSSAAGRAMDEAGSEPHWTFASSRVCDIPSEASESSHSSHRSLCPTDAHYPRKLSELSPGRKLSPFPEKYLGRSSDDVTGSAEASGRNAVFEYTLNRGGNVDLQRAASSNLMSPLSRNNPHFFSRPLTPQSLDPPTFSPAPLSRYIKQESGYQDYPFFNTPSKISSAAYPATPQHLDANPLSALERMRVDSIGGAAVQQFRVDSKDGVRTPVRGSGVKSDLFGSPQFAAGYQALTGFSTSRPGAQNSPSVLARKLLTGSQCFTTGRRPVGQGGIGPLGFMVGQLGGQGGALGEEASAGFVAPPMESRSIFSCHICSYIGMTKDEFDAHTASHYTHVCPHCPYKSRTRGRLQRHIGALHLAGATPGGAGGEERGQGGDGAQDGGLGGEGGGKGKRTGGGEGKKKEKKIYRCPNCDFTALSKDALFVHREMHMDPSKLLRCPQCPFWTHFKHHFEYHLRKHYASKPYSCSQCEYSCINRSMLTSHMKSHTNVYQFRCATEGCGFATKYMHTLQVHLDKTGHPAGCILNPDGSFPADGSGIFHRDDRLKRKGAAKRRRAAALRNSSFNNSEHISHNPNAVLQNLAEAAHNSESTLRDPLAITDASACDMTEKFSGKSEQFQVFPSHSEDGPSREISAAIQAAATAAAAQVLSNSRSSSNLGGHSRDAQPNWIDCPPLNRNFSNQADAPQSNSGNPTAPSNWNGQPINLGNSVPGMPPNFTARSDVFSNFSSPRCLPPNWNGPGVPPNFISPPGENGNRTRPNPNSPCAPPPNFNSPQGAPPSWNHPPGFRPNWISSPGAHSMRNNPSSLGIPQPSWISPPGSNPNRSRQNPEYPSPHPSASNFLSPGLNREQSTHLRSPYSSIPTVSSSPSIPPSRMAVDFRSPSAQRANAVDVMVFRGTQQHSGDHVWRCVVCGYPAATNGELIHHLSTAHMAPMNIPPRGGVQESPRGGQRANGGFDTTRISNPFEDQGRQDNRSQLQGQQGRYNDVGFNYSHPDDVRHLDNSENSMINYRRRCNNGARCEEKLASQSNRNATQHPLDGRDGTMQQEEQQRYTRQQDIYVTPSTMTPAAITSSSVTSSSVTSSSVTSSSFHASSSTLLLLRDDELSKNDGPPDRKNARLADASHNVGKARSSVDPLAGRGNKSNSESFSGSPRELCEPMDLSASNNASSSRRLAVTKRSRRKGVAHKLPSSTISESPEDPVESLSYAVSETSGNSDNPSRTGSSSSSQGADSTDAVCCDGVSRSMESVSSVTAKGLSEFSQNQLEAAVTLENSESAKNFPTLLTQRERLKNASESPEILKNLMECSGERGADGGRAGDRRQAVVRRLEVQFEGVDPGGATAKKIAGEITAGATRETSEGAIERIGGGVTEGATGEILGGVTAGATVATSDSECGRSQSKPESNPVQASDQLLPSPVQPCDDGDVLQGRDDTQHDDDDDRPGGNGDQHGTDDKQPVHNDAANSSSGKAEAADNGAEGDGLSSKGDVILPKISTESNSLSENILNPSFDLDSMSESNNGKFILPSSGDTSAEHRSNNGESSSSEQGREIDSPEPDLEGGSGGEKGANVCVYCCITFPERTMHDLHMSFHRLGGAGVASDPFQCAQCAERCADRTEFYLHIARVAHA